MVSERCGGKIEEGSREKRKSTLYLQQRGCSPVFLSSCLEEKPLFFLFVLITRSERSCHGCGAESQPAVVLPPQLLIQLDLIRFHLSY